MAKKITFTMLVLLIVSALVFVSCSQETGGKVPGPAPAPVTKIENKVGEVSGNIVYNGDFESGTDSDLTGDGAGIEVVEIEEGHALLVDQQETYGEVMMDITKYYGAGKSFYVEGWFKDAESTNTADLTAKLSFNIVTGGGYTTEGKTYDIPGQYDGDWLSDDEAEEIFGIETNCIGEDISDGQWHKVSAILDAEQIDAVMTSEDDQCHWTGDKTMYLLAVVWYVGTYPDQGGYKYYLDNVVVKDLNRELPTQGRTYEAPEEPDEEEPEEDLEDL